MNLFISAGAGVRPDENSSGIGNLNFLENFSIGVSSASFRIEQLCSVCRKKVTPQCSTVIICTFP